MITMIFTSTSSFADQTQSGKIKMRGQIGRVNLFMQSNPITLTDSQGRSVALNDGDGLVLRLSPASSSFHIFLKSDLSVDHEFKIKDGFPENNTENFAVDGNNFNNPGLVISGVTMENDDSSGGMGATATLTGTALLALDPGARLAAGRNPDLIVHTLLGPGYPSYTTIGTSIYHEWKTMQVISIYDFSQSSNGKSKLLGEIDALVSKGYNTTGPIVIDRGYGK